MKVELRKLEIGEQIRVGDWCCGQGGLPTPVVQQWDNCKLTKTHWPHYRVVFPNAFLQRLKRPIK